MLIKLAYRSLASRSGSVLLTILMMSISIFVLLSVENIRIQTKESFQQNVSDVDLIVGPRTGQLNLMLYSIFHIGVPSHNLSWDSYQMLTKRPEVAWTIPLVLGDSHRGYRVIGTTEDMFTHFRYRTDQALHFQHGHAFTQESDAVIGAELARKLDYKVGDSITLAHGFSDTRFSRHDNHPFKITGILQPTGTPIDRSVYISLAGFEAMHAGMRKGATTQNQTTSITAVLVGLTSKIKTFSLQREINTYPNEALEAIMPGVVLSSLWSMLSGIEQALLIISVLVLFGAIVGMVNVLLLSMRERRNELAILRALGYRPSFLFALLQLEALLMTISASMLAVLALWIGDKALREWLLSQFGLYLSDNLIQINMIGIILIVIVTAMISALIPAINAYRQGLNFRLN